MATSVLNIFQLTVIMSAKFVGYYTLDDSIFVETEEAIRLKVSLGYDW